MFKYSGSVLPSKSWLNRMQVIQYFNPGLKISAENDFLFQSDDTLFLQKAIVRIPETNVFDLGLGGTSLRFFVFLISCLEGEWTVHAAPRLWQRPQQELVDILKQLGVDASLELLQMKIISKGWRPGAVVRCSAKNSSQFVSGLLLSAWNLESDLQIEIEKPFNSFSYLQMTLDLLKKTGMQIETYETEQKLMLKVLKRQTARLTELAVEPDLSSAFSLVSAALVDGEAVIQNWVHDSSQPDRIFTELFKQMNIDWQTTDHIFKVMKQKTWKSINCNLADSPDLFPVLSVLAAFAEGISVLNGASQLKLKESDRIAKTRELLSLAGFKSEAMDDGLKIYGRSSSQDLNKYFEFDPDHDHRMAMAAALLKLKGYNISIQHPEVVNKSYPGFWKDIGL